MDKGDRLDSLELAVRNLDRAESLVTDLAIKARLSGASWGEIGGALGVTKQAAHARFAALMPYLTPLGPNDD